MRIDVSTVSFHGEFSDEKYLEPISTLTLAGSTIISAWSKVIKLSTGPTETQRLGLCIQNVHFGVHSLSASRQLA
jgi:hypothetical protein